MKKHFLIIEETITGFTLAEVLITLTIIGVIAALTIPALIQNIQDQQLRTAFKATYSILNQANSRILADKGGSFAGVCPDYNSNYFKDLYVPYLSVTKNCPASAVGNCWASDGNYYSMSGTAINTWSTVWSGTSPAGLALANGAYVMFSFRVSDCQNNSGSLYYCGAIDIDVNGAKGPNMYGKDLFEMWQTKDGLKPLGSQGDAYGAACGAGTWGWGCAATYLRQ